MRLGFERDDINMAIEAMKSLLATIPYTASALAASKYESFYQTILMKQCYAQEI